MNTNELEKLIQKTLKEMEVKGYKVQTIGSERNTFNQLLKYCKEKNIECYDFDVGMNFLEEHYKLSKRTKQYKHRRIRSVYILEWAKENKDISKLVIPRKVTILENKKNEKILTEYKEYLKRKNFAYSTIKAKELVLINFLNYATDITGDDFKSINKTLIYDYINILKKTNGFKALYSKKYHIKKFYDYLYNRGLSKFDGYDIFYKIVKYERTTPISYFTENEVKMILKDIDRTTNQGKKDYAVILLALIYGLRNCDIINLKIKDIDWNNNKIKIIQKKTKKQLTLDLIDDVKYALIDYIKNARANTESEYIFLKNKFNKEYNYETKSLYSCISKHIDNVNIDLKGRTKGLHALRHSCATLMLKNQIQLPVISNILGHSNIQMTNMYLTIDFEKLKKIPLEVPNNE